MASLIKQLFCQLWSKETILLSICLCFAAFLICFKLSHYPIFIWDEAIYANNSLEMVISGDPIVLRLDSQPNTYNSKPPLVIWLQALSILLFGPNELAIRIPSALAALSTCVLIFLFANKVLKNPLIGFISVIFLCSSPGFIRAHVSRTGDLDAVLVFFITCYILIFISYVIEKPKNYKPYFIGISLCLVFAFLTKSIAGFIPLVGLLLVSIWDKSYTKIISLKYTWICATIILLFCTIFYLIREWRSPGYLDITFNSEYIRYFQNIMPWHEHPFYFYVMNWVYMDFFWPYLILLPICIILAILQKTTRVVSFYLLLIAITYLFIISLPKVKLEWYDAPLYPLFSLLLGIGVVNIIGAFKTSKYSNPIIAGALAMTLFFITISTIKVLNRINNNLGLPIDKLEREGSFMKEVKIKLPDFHDYKVVMQVAHPAHLTQAKFYATSYNMMGSTIKVESSVDSIKPGGLYLYCQDTVNHFINNSFEYDTIYNNKKCLLVEIIRIK